MTTGSSEVTFLLRSGFLLGSPTVCLFRSSRLGEASQGRSCWMSGVHDLAVFCCLRLLHCSLTYLINSLIQSQNHSDCRSSSRLSNTAFYVPRATAARDPRVQQADDPQNNSVAITQFYFLIFAFLAMNMLPSRETIGRSLWGKRRIVKMERH